VVKAMEVKPGYQRFGFIWSNCFKHLFLFAVHL